MFLLVDGRVLQLVLLVQSLVSHSEAKERHDTIALGSERSFGRVSNIRCFFGVSRAVMDALVHW